MSALSTFPSSFSIPPPCFYTMGGLATFLNNNPIYKQYFIGTTEMSNDLLSTNSTLCTLGYNPANVPLPLSVTNLSQSQSLRYQQQLKLFQDVYAYNSNAYVNFITTPNNPQGPIYFRFQTYSDYTNYHSAVMLVNKMYPFQKMAYAQNQAGSTLSWIVPFPLLHNV